MALESMRGNVGVSLALCALVVLFGCAKNAEPQHASATHSETVDVASAKFFSVERTGADAWRLVDPNGATFRIRGVDHVRYEGHWCGKLNTFPYRDWNNKHYPNRAAWERETLGRLKSWGFNTLTGKPDESLLGRGFAHTHTLHFGKRLCGKKRPQEDWIAQGQTPCRYFPNVFSTNFVQECEAWAERECAPRRNDRNLIGYFLDNELAWWGTAPVDKRGSAEAMYDTAMSLPEGHSARRAAESFKGTKAEFLSLVAERYFAVTCAAVRKADPNHLVLGARFAGFGGAAEPVWVAAGHHCDVVSFNLYPWIDFKSNKIWVWHSDRRELGRTFDHYQSLTRKPFLITEWSFIGLDAGLPCKKGMGQRFPTQTERAKAIKTLCDFFDLKGYVVGDDYFMWVDEPKLGIGKEFGEDSNYGLVSGCGEPWKEVVEVFKNRGNER